MYPSQQLLEEVGRVTVAGSRLDVQMGFLWWHLDPQGVDLVQARATPGRRQAAGIRSLAKKRLRGPLCDEVLRALNDAAAVRALRNEVVHQDWVLRGREAMRPVADVASLQEEDLAAYLEEWEREAKESPDWLRLPARSLDFEPTQTLDDLRGIERRLCSVTDRVAGLTFAVASARETGHPAGWVW